MIKNDVVKKELGGKEGQVLRARKIVILVIVVVLIIATVVMIFKFQKYKKGKEYSNIGEKEISTEDMRSKIGDNTLFIGDIKLEMLSIDILEGRSISAETKYPAKNFQDKLLPVKESKVEIIDWDSIFKEAPEYEKYHLADYGEYTEAEEDEIEEKYKPVIDKYTYVESKPQKLYFIKCRLTNLSTNTIEDALPIYVSTKSLDTGEVTYDADICYFDKAIYTEGEARNMKYFFFRLDSNESMECTIGLAVPQGENEKYYYGEPITGDLPYDPDALPDFINIDTIPTAK